MTQLRTVIFLLCAGLIGSVGLAQNPKPFTVDELVAKNVEAKGGAAALQGIQSLRLTGKLLANQGQIQLAYVEIKKRPGAVRSEGSLQGMTQIQAYDGKE